MKEEKGIHKDEMEKRKIRWRRTDDGKIREGGQRVANDVFLCFQFVGGVQIGDNEMGGKRVGWVGGRRSGRGSNRGGRGERRTEGTIGHGACSQLARVEVRVF